MSQRQNPAAGRPTLRRSLPSNSLSAARDGVPVGNRLSRRTLCASPCARHCYPPGSLPAAKILPVGWSAGLQPALRGGSFKVGCQPALHFGGGLAALDCCIEARLQLTTKTRTTHIWSAGLQPALCGGSFKAGCKPALHFGGGLAALGLGIEAKLQLTSETQNTHIWSAGLRPGSNDPQLSAPGRRPALRPVLRLAF